MKLRLLFVVMFVATLSAYADDAHIIIKQKSGNETVLELSTNPVITFSGENMVVTSSLTTIAIPLADVDSYTAYDATTAIHPLTDAPQFANGHVLFNGLSKGADVCIYTASGRLVSRQQADASGHAAVSLGSFPKGVYFVRTPSNSIKIINK